MSVVPSEKGVQRDARRETKEHEGTWTRGNGKYNQETGKEEKVRGANISLKNRLAKLELQLRKKDELAENLHVPALKAESAELWNCRQRLAIFRWLRGKFLRSSTSAPLQR